MTSISEYLCLYSTPSEEGKTVRLLAARNSYEAQQNVNELLRNKTIDKDVISYRIMEKTPSGEILEGDLILI